MNTVSLSHEQQMEQFKPLKHLPEDSQAHFYVYHQQFAGNEQFGLIGDIKIHQDVDKYVLPHEQTIEAKAQGIYNHILGKSYDFDPIMLVYEERQQLATIKRSICQTSTAVLSFDDDDGISHAIYHVTDQQVVEQLTQEVNQINSLLLADGHHRFESTRRINADSPSDSFYINGMIFSGDEVCISSFHQVIPMSCQFAEKDIFAFINQYFTRVTSADQLGKYGVEVYAFSQWHYFNLDSKVAQLAPSSDFPTKVHVCHQLLDNAFGFIRDKSKNQITYLANKAAANTFIEQQNLDNKVIIHAFSPSIDELFALAKQGTFLPPHSTRFVMKPTPGIMKNQALAPPTAA
jgi:uncharacterized protein (DUF1015 family)